tara:strand:+ start:467 stop:4204 length:3738 start_codon:yes stop_codon:yes gene_type:complete
MAISINSQDFREAAQELDNLAAQKLLDEEKYNQILTAKGFDKNEFKEAYIEYADTPKEELDDQAQITNIPIIDPAIRTVGRAFGEAGRGVADTAEDFFPNFTAKVGSLLDKTGDYVPEIVKEYADQIFDPYHGDGVYGNAEEMVGNIGSYFVPATGIIKGTRLVSGLAKNAKLINSSAKAAQINRAIKTNKALKTLEKIPKVGKVAKLAKNLALYGTAFAASATIVEDPQENGVNLLLTQFPESTAALESLAINPNDTAAQQRINAFLNNMGLEVAFFGGLKGLMKTYQGVKAGTKKVIPTKLNKLLTATTSKRGLTDDVLANFVKQDAVAKNAYNTAVEESKELSKLMKKSNFKSSENVSLVNEALAGDKAALAKLPTLVKPKVIAMRKNIDGISNFFLKKDRTSGPLNVVIDENLGTYITRTFEMFENPQYLRDMKKVLKKNYKNISNNQLDSISHKGMKSISDFLINGYNLTPQTAAVNIKKALEGYKGDKGLFLSDLAGASMNKTGSSVKGFFKRKKLDERIKLFLGEVKDPSLNYVNAYQKLAVYKAEIDFLETLKDDMLKSGAAKEAIKSKGKFFAPADVGKREAVNDVVEERLSKIFGTGPINKGQIKNPLQNLYVDPNYKQALKDGLQAINPTTNRLLRGWLAGKSTSQLSLTALNPATHAVNVLGNNLFMAANGFIPNTRGSVDALEFATRNLFPLSNKKLTQKWNRYRELGITGSDVLAETLRANIKRFTSSPNMYDKPSIARKVMTSPYKATKKTLGKIIDVYQMEDDIYKIMHFESTKKYLAKAFPEESISKIEDMAAKRTRDLMPNYKIAPKFLKELRGAPIGDFATFAAESTRVAKNLIAYTVEDGISGNSVLMSLAARRLGGMTIAGLGADVLSKKSMMMMGVTEDERDAADIVGPQYNYDVPQLYLSGVENVNGKKVLKSVSTGSIDPFTWVKSTARFAHNLINDEAATIDRFKNIRYDPELQKMTLAMADKTLAPFVGTSIITDQLLDSVQSAREGDLTSAGVDLAGAFFFPGILNFLNKRAQAEAQVGYVPKGQRERTGSGSILSSAFKGVPGETDWEALLGIKVNTLDLSSSIPYNIGYDLSNINKEKKLSRLLKNKLTSLEKLTKQTYRGMVEKGAGKLNEQDLIAAKKSDELARLRTEKEIRMYIKAYKDLGFTMEEIVRNLKGKVNINLLVSIANNLHTPSSLTKADIENYQKNLKPLGINLPFDYFEKMNQSIVNTKIDEED